MPRDVSNPGKFVLLQRAQETLAFSYPLEHLDLDDMANPRILQYTPLVSEFNVSSLLCSVTVRVHITLP